MSLHTSWGITCWVLICAGTVATSCTRSKQYDGADDGATGAAGDPGFTASATGAGGSANGGGNSTAGSTGNTTMAVTSSGGTSSGGTSSGGTSSGGASSGGTEADTSSGDAGAGGDPGSGGDGGSGGVGGSGGGTSDSGGGSEATTSGGSMTTGGSGGGNTSDDPELGAACDAPGALGCNGAAQKLRLICEDGVWTNNGSCNVNENCEQTSGVCAPIDGRCDGLAVGDRYCDDKTVRECGPDRVNSEAVEECSAACLVLEGQGQCVIVKQVAAGAHTCAVLSTGQLRCWGYNTSGQLGYGHQRNIGDEPYEMPPPDVPLGEPVKHVAVGVVAAGGSHTCAVLVSGSVRCWGQNQAGQLGLGHTETVGDTEFPTNDVPLGEPATQLALGAWYSCALLESGAVKCWGNTLLETDSSDPAEFYLEDIPLGSRAVQIASHAGHVCALLETEAVRCWGANFWGETGMPPENEGLSPPIALGGGVSHIGLGNEMSCAVSSEGGYVRCWGDGRGFRLGTGDDEPVGQEAADMPPFAVNLGTIGSSANQVDASSNHACAVMHSGVVKCWGAGSSSGYGTTELVVDFPPPNVELNGQAVALSVGDNGYTCAILMDGNLQCWGSNSAGSLGLGHTDYIGDDETPADAGLVPVF